MIFKLNDNFTVTDVAFCYYKKVSSSYSLEINNRSHSGLTLILSEEIRFFSEKEDLIATGGDIIIQKKGDNYRLEANGMEVEYIVISYLSEPEDAFSIIGRIYRTNHTMRYADAFKRVADTYFYSETSYKPLIRALTQEIICNIIKDNETNIVSDVKNSAIAAKYYIEEYSGKFLSSSDIAKAAGCSESQLRQLFRKTYGMSPNKYLNLIRIERAKKMLSSNLFTIGEIATLCGFKNVYYFSRVFKDLTGTTPGKY